MHVYKVHVCSVKLGIKDKEWTIGQNKIINPSYCNPLHLAVSLPHTHIHIAVAPCTSVSLITSVDDLVCLKLMDYGSPS